MHDYFFSLGVKADKDISSSLFFFELHVFFGQRKQRRLILLLAVTSSLLKKLFDSNAKLESAYSLKLGPRLFSMPVQIPLNKSFITLANCGLNRQLSCIPSLDTNNAYENHIFCIFITNPLTNTPVLIFFGHLILCPIENGKYVLFFVYGVNSPCSDKLHLGFLADSFSQSCVLPVTLFTIFGSTVFWNIL